MTVADAVEMGIEPEPYTRTGDLPRKQVRQLTQQEYEHFQGTFSHSNKNGTPVYDCWRYELNSILPVSRRMEYIAGKLEEHGVQKVVPPDDELPDLAKSIYRDEFFMWVDDILYEILGLRDIKDELADEFEEAFELHKAREYIEGKFEDNPKLPWREALTNRLSEKKDTAKIKQRTIDKLNERRG